MFDFEIAEPKCKNPLGTISSHFSDDIIDDVNWNMYEYYATVKLHESELVKDYYESDDRVSRIFAIESYRLFYLVPEIERLVLELKINKGHFKMYITKDQIEEAYRLKIEDILEYDKNKKIKIGNKFQNQFIKKYDHKRYRDFFVLQYVDTLPDFE